jgi:hypothetical protein
MTRAHLPGSFRNGGTRVDTSRHCCDGRCMGGDCPLIVRRVPAQPCAHQPVRQRAAVGVQLTGGRIPRARRVRRFFRAIASFLLNRKVDLS